MTRVHDRRPRCAHVERYVQLLALISDAANRYTPGSWISESPRRPHRIGPAMKRYLRRGYFPDDADSAYMRWRATTTLTPPRPTRAKSLAEFEQFVKSIWLAGWYQRGEVAYGEADIKTRP